MRLHLMALVVAFGSVLPGHAVVAEAIERNTDRPGGDLRGVWVNNAPACQRECRNDRQCRAWTYVKRDHKCILKNIIGQARTDACCTSGVLVRPGLASPPQPPVLLPLARLRPSARLRSCFPLAPFCLLTTSHPKISLRME
jgi:PAN domain